MIRELIAATKRQLYRWRSAITGRFVTADYADENRSTTVSERVGKPSKRPWIEP